MYALKMLCTAATELGLENCREEVEKRREIGGFVLFFLSTCPPLVGEDTSLAHTMFARGLGEHNASFL